MQHQNMALDKARSTPCASLSKTKKKHLGPPSRKPEIYKEQLCVLPAQQGLGGWGGHLT